jgi:hypothetical protein
MKPAGSLMARRMLNAGIVFLASTCVSLQGVGIAGSSNIVWGEPNQFGSVPIPGTGVVRLPTGEVLVSVAVVMPARGNATPNLLLPDDLSFEVHPASAGPRPTVTRDVHPTANAAGGGADTQRQVWTIDVPRAGDYRVKVRGDFNGIGVRPHLWLGHGPPLPPAEVPLVAAVIGLFSVAAYLMIAAIVSARKKKAEGAVDRP